VPTPTGQSPCGCPYFQGSHGGTAPTGKLHKSIEADILRQYILEKEVTSRAELSMATFRVDQAIMDFRLQNQLIEPKSFQDWLLRNGITYDEFHESVAFGIKVDKLKTAITEPKLESYFTERQPVLDRVVLSRIVVTDEQLALDLKEQILGDRTQFESLAKQHSLTGDINGLMGPVSRGTLPDVLKTAVELAQVGELIGPLQINERYCLFRVEEFLPAALEGSLKQELQNQLFDQWLHEQLQGMKVKLAVK